MTTNPSPETRVQEDSKPSPVETFELEKNDIARLLVSEETNISEPWYKNLGNNPKPPNPNRIAKKDLWRAIRAKCLDCSTGNRAEVAKCPVTDCCLFIFRFGKALAKVKRSEFEIVDAEIEKETE